MRSSRDPSSTSRFARLPPGGAAFLMQLAQSECLGDAAAAALEATPDFDLAVNLAGLFASGLVAGILS